MGNPWPAGPSEDALLRQQPLPRVEPGERVSDDAVFLTAVDAYGIPVRWPRLAGRPVYIGDGIHWVRVKPLIEELGNAPR